MKHQQTYFQYFDSSLFQELLNFREFGSATDVSESVFEQCKVPTFTNEFWTSKQRAGCGIHEISYRACFKPQLPRFFIERLTEKGDIVYDPFMGRGTTLIEAALLGRKPTGNDINPLSRILAEPRFVLPALEDIADRLSLLDLEQSIEVDHELLVFYHPKTLRILTNLRDYFLKKKALDHVDRWIRMVATNRLTGHSSGFFSVYTLPPNQAVSMASQIKINEKRQQTPPERDVNAIILKKSKTLLNRISPDERKQLSSNDELHLLTGNAYKTPAIASQSVKRR